MDTTNLKDILATLEPAWDAMDGIQKQIQVRHIPNIPGIVKDEVQPNLSKVVALLSAMQVNPAPELADAYNHFEAYIGKPDAYEDDAIAEWKQGKSQFNAGYSKLEAAAAQQ